MIFCAADFGRDRHCTRPQGHRGLHGDFRSPPLLRRWHSLIDQPATRYEPPNGIRILRPVNPALRGGHDRPFDWMTDDGEGPA